MLQKRKRPITQTQVESRMKKLRVTGWSSMGKPTLDEHMECLDELDRILKGRRAAVRERAVKR